MKRETVLLFTVVLALVLLGALMVYSAKTVKLYEKDVLDGLDTTVFLRAHLVHVALGGILLLAAARLDYRHYRNRWFLIPIMVGVLVLLILVLIFGEKVNGARRWLIVFGFSLQPSEFAKLAIVIWLAVKLSEGREHIRGLRRGFLPPMAMTFVFAVLILAERDLGGPIVIGSVALLMCLVAGVWWPYIAGTVVAGGGAVFMLCWTSETRWARILAWLDPSSDPDGAGFHLIQSLRAFARGGIEGTGLGASEQKLYYLPEAYNDFIFAVWGEETGLAGTLLLVGLFMLLMFVSRRIAVCAPDLFGTMLATGIGALMGVQALFNMAVTTGLLPTKGLALPFISAGGSALIVNLALTGILLNIAYHARERNAELVTASAARRGTMRGAGART